MKDYFAGILILYGALSLVSARSSNGYKFQSLDDNKSEIDKKKLETEDKNNENSSFWNDFSLLYKIYQQCSKDNLTVCLKVKLLTALDRASRNVKEIKFIDGIQFLKDDSDSDSDSDSDNTPSRTESEIIESLPRSLDAKENTLNSMIFQKLLSFFSSHTLQVKFADDDFTEEGRKKKDKKGGAFIMIPLLLGGTFIPIAYGALAMLAGKALIVSKLALVLASIIGIKKLLGGGHKESQHEVVVSSGGHGSGWGRDFDLAYSAYSPNNASSKEIEKSY